MDKFCGKCGARLTGPNGTCPRCSGRSGKTDRLLAAAAILLAVVILVLFRVSRQPERPTEPWTEPTAVQTTEEKTAATTEAAEEAMNLPTAYIRAIREVEEKANSYYSRGQLYDLNDDGIPEMALSYWANVPETQMMEDGTENTFLYPFVVCDLYTFDGERAVKLMDSEKLEPQAAGYFGACAFAEIDGRKYFLTEWETGPTSIPEEPVDRAPDELNDYTEGYKKRYTLEGSRLVLQDNMTYRYHSYAKLSNFSASLNGWDISEKEYNTWMQTLSGVDWLGHMNGPTFEDLVIQLERNDWRRPVSVENPVKTVSASSTYTGDRGDHSARNLIDGNVKTNWTEGAKWNGLGQSVTFELRGPYHLEGMKIWAGNHVDEKRYNDNARPKEITLSFSDGSSLEFELKDAMVCQTLYFDIPVITDSIKLTIESVYPGGKYEDTVISEVELMANLPRDP